MVMARSHFPEPGVHSGWNQQGPANDELVCAQPPRAPYHPAGEQGWSRRDQSGCLLGRVLIGLPRLAANPQLPMKFQLEVMAA